MNLIISKCVTLLFLLMRGFPQETSSKEIKDELVEKMTPDAKCNLGAKYYYGIVESELTQAERDTKAIELYKESGTPEAKHNLADMYYDGRAGLELTQAERDVIAVNLLKKSNTQDANILLGIMYIQGRAGLDLSEEEKRTEAEKLFKEAGISNKTSTSLNFLHKLKAQDVKINITIEKTHAYGIEPISLKISPDGQTLYVANHYSRSISIFKTSSLNRVERVINIGGKEPISLDLSPNGNILYVLSTRSNSIIRINTVNGSFLGCVDIEGSSPDYMLLSKDGMTIYASETKSGRILKIKESTGEITSSIKIENFPTKMTLSKDGKELFVQCDRTNSIIKIDTNQWIVMDEILLVEGTPMDHIPSPDSSLMYVGTRSPHTISVYDIKTHNIKGKKITEGIKYPRGLCLIKNGELLLVTNTINKTISLIDTDTMELIGRPVYVQSSSFSAYEKDGHIVVYAVNYGNNSISKVTISFEQIGSY